MNFDDRPNRLRWPPIILVISVLGSLAANYLQPIDVPLFSNTPSGRIAGVALMCVGLSLDVAALLTMRKAQTNILANRAADKLLTEGIFGISRNPIYLGNTIMIFGATGAFQIGWFAIFAVFAGIVVHFLAIRREEIHLAHKFGNAWQAYVENVPRWILY